MKKWTCYIISALLMFLSALPVKAEDIMNYSLEVLLGISSAQTSAGGLDISVSGIKITDGGDNTAGENEAGEESEEKAGEEAGEDEAGEKEERATKMGKILIYHTHSDEAYLKGERDYIETSAGRTLDENYSVIKTGASLKEKLEEKGFTVIHSKADNVSAGFNKAYQTSLENIKQYIGKVDIYVDLHRDAYNGSEPNCITYGGREYAYIAFVVANGTDYTQKPHFEANYALAKKMTEKLNALCPGICKSVIIRNARYNQHISDSCLLAEIGNEQNTLEQATASSEILAEAFAAVFD